MSNTHLRTRKWFFLLSLTLTAALCAVNALAGVDANGNPYMDGEIIVKFKSNRAPSAIEAVNRDLGGSILQAFVGDSDLFLVKLPENTNVEEGVGLYNHRSSEIEYAEPNYIYYPIDTIPNDSLYNSQYALVRINAPAGWDITTGTQTLSSPITIREWIPRTRTSWAIWAPGGISLPAPIGRRTRTAMERIQPGPSPPSEITA